MRGRERIRPQNPGLDIIRAEEVKPEEVGKLELEYRDGTPVLIVTDGILVPADLALATAAGDLVATYR